MTDKAKDKMIAAMATAAIEEIVTHPRSPETMERSAEFPLGGLVHIEGIGQVSLKRLQAELRARKH